MKKRSGQQSMKPVATGSATFEKNKDGDLWRVPDPPRKIPLPPVFPHRWACTYGEDEFGLWEDFEVKGVRQRLRWIPPGRFRMGSPDAEVDRERLSIEARHEVALTRGYWLADTACTQALWEAVLGKNPSRFQDDPENPVEQVSRNEIRQEFLPALNQLVPGLEAVLPSEAQWEYACRAGTETPFWFGDQIKPEQVNYNGNLPYSIGKKGEYREKTVAVKSLRANGWGLYEMHGNVSEWCDDVLAGYLSEAVTDPLVTEDESEVRQRILRGGSWRDNGGRCRSAVRVAYTPEVRLDWIGFRVARGAG